MPAFSIYEYQDKQPPKLSFGCRRTIAKFKNGWKPNRRIRRMGFEEKCELFRIYLWEYHHVVFPLLQQQRLGGS